VGLGRVVFGLLVASGKVVSALLGFCNARLCFGFDI